MHYAEKQFNVRFGSPTYPLAVYRIAVTKSTKAIRKPSFSILPSGIFVPKMEFLVPLFFFHFPSFHIEKKIVEYWFLAPAALTKPRERLLKAVHLPDSSLLKFPFMKGYNPLLVSKRGLDFLLGGGLYCSYAYHIHTTMQKYW